MIDIIPDKSDKAAKPLSIYIHIPFCARKCAYCDFLSHPIGTDCTGGMGAYVERYVQSICTELSCYGELAHSHEVQTIYIGGGTPSLIDSDYITIIMSAARDSFDVAEDAEISIEVNPGTLTGEKAASYIQCGINRMSIGLQSAQSDELGALGRIHNYDQFLAAYNTAREAGFRNINIDVMSAVPRQTLRSYLDTLDKVMRCGPEHISAYSLIVEENTPLALDSGLLARIPDEDTDREMYKVTDRLLGRGGWHRYEVSNYAKHGYECRHNLVYWTLGEYIGIGTGASSFVGGRRYANTPDIRSYIAVLEDCRRRLQCGGHDAASAAELAETMRRVDEEVDAERLMEEYMFLGLRMTNGVSAEEFYGRFGHSIYDVYGSVIKTYTASGHMTDDRGLIRLTGKGIDVSNVVLADFLLE